MNRFTMGMAAWLVACGGGTSEVADEVVAGSDAGTAEVVIEDDGVPTLRIVYQSLISGEIEPCG